jgi:hypothetical protein
MMPKHTRATKRTIAKSRSVGCGAATSCTEMKPNLSHIVFIANSIEFCLGDTDVSSTAFARDADKQDHFGDRAINRATRSCKAQPLRSNGDSHDSGRQATAPAKLRASWKHQGPPARNGGHGHGQGERRGNKMAAARRPPLSEPAKVQLLRPTAMPRGRVMIAVHGPKTAVGYPMWKLDIDEVGEPRQWVLEC